MSTAMSISVDAEKSILSCAEEVSQDEVMAPLHSVHLKPILTKSHTVLRAVAGFFFELLFVTVSHLVMWLGFRLYIVSLLSFCKTLEIVLFLNFARLEPTRADDIPCQLPTSL